jgi:hypothetical protein
VWVTGGSCEHGNEPSDFLKDGEFIVFVGDYKLFKKNSAVWWSVYVSNCAHSYFSKLTANGLYARGSNPGTDDWISLFPFSPDWLCVLPRLFPRG